MAHRIRGLVVHADHCEPVASALGVTASFALPQALRFLPLQDKQSIAGLGPEATGSAELLKGFYGLTKPMLDALAPLSGAAPFAYVETRYFGGRGGQAAAYLAGGEARYVASRPAGYVPGDEPRPINEALRLLGVVVGEGQLDRFDAVGFGRYRSNDDFHSG